MYAKDLSLSEGVTLDVDPEMIICHVIAPSAAMLAAEAAAEAAEEAGDAAPDGAGDGDGEGEGEGEPDATFPADAGLARRRPVS